MEKYVGVDVLLGKTITQIINKHYNELWFHTSEDEWYRMYHNQDCCESVSIEEIIGDLDDLVNSPVTMAEEATQDGDNDDWGSSTWAFYKFATVKGYVTIRWLGSSNGYYSESVDFVLTDCKGDDPNEI